MKHKLSGAVIGIMGEAEVKFLSSPSELQTKTVFQAEIALDSVSYVIVVVHDAFCLL